MTEAQKIKESTIKKWILYMCYLNDQYGGISELEIFENKNKAITQDQGDLMKMVRELKKEGFLDENSVNGRFNFLYKITLSGRALIFNQKHTSEVEFQKVLRLAPPEYELRIRLKNLEKFAIFGVFTFMSYTSAVILISKTPILTLILIGMSFFFMPLAIINFTRVTLPYLIEFTERIFKKTALNMLNYSLRISRIVTITLIIVALGLAFYAGNLKFGWVGIAGVSASIIFSCVFGSSIRNLIDWQGWLSNKIKKLGEFIQKESE